MRPLDEMTKAERFRWGLGCFVLAIPVSVLLFLVLLFFTGVIQL